MKLLIKNTERRFISYKNMLKNIYEDKINFPVNDEFVNWYKSFLRENKNFEENLLKRLIIEKNYSDEGLNLPYCYLL